MSEHTVKDRATQYLNSQIMATESCIERLGGITNGVNRERMDFELGKLARDVDVYRYLLALAEADVNDG
jgi:hypothetical protein